MNKETLEKLSPEGRKEILKIEGKLSEITQELNLLEDLYEM